MNCPSVPSPGAIADNLNSVAVANQSPEAYAAGVLEFTARRIEGPDVAYCHDRMFTSVIGPSVPSVVTEPLSV